MLNAYLRSPSVEVRTWSETLALKGSARVGTGALPFSFRGFLSPGEPGLGAEGVAGPGERFSMLTALATIARAQEAALAAPPRFPLLIPPRVAEAAPRAGAREEAPRKTPPRPPREAGASVQPGDVFAPGCEI
jgi:hypothetical protein